MVLHRFFQGRLQVQESLVDGRGVIAIERNHPGPRLAAADDLEGVRLDSLYDGVLATVEAGSREKPRSAPARFDCIIGVSVAPG
jgi:hypothetical protein